MDPEIYVFAKCIISTFSDLITPKLQTSRPSRKYQLFYCLSDTLFETESIDVSKKTIDVVYYDRKRQKMYEDIHRQLSNDQSVFILMRKWFKECGMKKVELVIGLENTGIYSHELCLSLESAGIDYYCFNSLHLKRSFGLTRGKNDKVDAWRIAYYCYLHREELVYCKMSDNTIMRLQGLSSERKRLIKHIAEYKAYLTDRKAMVTDNIRNVVQRFWYMNRNL